MNFEDISDRKYRLRECLNHNIPLLDRSYVNLLHEIIADGEICGNRTANRSLAISGAMIKHDMNNGFPLLTTKKVLYKAMAVELEGFIKGVTDKSWYKDRNCNIWNEWCNPKKLDQRLIVETMEVGKPSRERIEELQAEENDLGKIYGYQWNNFGGINQLENLIHRIKTAPECRRHIVSAWNPAELGEMALPPCHVLFQINNIGGRLDLVWYQRSVDTPLGLPFNISSYALLLSLICKVTGNVPGMVIGMLSNVHIYENQVDGVLEHLRTAEVSPIKNLPKLKLDDSLESIFDFDASKSFEIINYEHNPFIRIPISI